MKKLLWSATVVIRGLCLWYNKSNIRCIFCSNCLKALHESQRFNDSWFHEPYFSRKRIFHESFEGTEHKIIVSKSANKYQIIWHRRFTVLSISLSDKSFGNVIFYGAKITNCKDETINLSNVYLLFDLFWCQNTFREIIQHKENLICFVV